jgi:NADH dehydrogenase FAD-containing subunit
MLRSGQALTKNVTCTCGTPVPAVLAQAVQAGQALTKNVRTGKKRVPREQKPKQRGTILKTDKNMHRGGMKWN